MKGIGHMREKSEMAGLRKKVALLRRMGHFSPPDPNVQIRRAVAEHDLRDAYRLVHDVFVNKGYIDLKPTGIRLRAFEAIPEMATFVAGTEGRIVGVMSIIPDTPDMGLPSDAGFEKELDELRRAKRRVAEVTNLAVAPRYRRSNVFTELARAIHAHAVAMHYDDVFIAISPGHVGFFKDILQFLPCGDARNYSSEKDDTVVGLRWNMRTLREQFADADSRLGDDALLIDHFYENNPCHDFVLPWATVAKRTFLDARVLCQLFVDGYNALDHFTPDQREAIRRRWGEAVFAEVCHGQRPEMAPA